MTTTAYLRSLIEAINPEREAVRERLLAVAAAATPAISAIAIDLFVDQDAEGPFDAWARYEGPGGTELNLLVGDARHVFGVNWGELSWEPDVPPRPIGWSREDLEAALFTGFGDWLSELIPSPTTHGILWELHLPDSGAEPRHILPRSPRTS